MTDVSGVPVAVTTGVCKYMNTRPGSPSGSDVSDSSAPGLSSNNSYNNSNIYKPVARSGGINVNVSVLPETESETTSWSDDLVTSLCLSLPGAYKVNESTWGGNAEAAPVSSESGPPKGLVGFSAEFMAVMQGMVRQDVRTYVAALEQQRGGACFPWISRNVGV